MNLKTLREDIILKEVTAKLDEIVAGSYDENDIIKKMMHDYTEEKFDWDSLFVQHIIPKGFQEELIWEIVNQILEAE